MKRIKRPMFRYGEPDFDADYVRWGLHDAETQAEEARSVLRIAGNGSPLRILDLACGTGTHAVHWAREGHEVTAVDLSETFVARGRQAAQEEGVAVEFVVADVTSLPCRGGYDLVTWIEPSFFDPEMVRRVHGMLAPGGAFVFDDRNPEHARTRQRGSNWRNWREEEGVFYLERHETDPDTGLRESAWITIDPGRQVIEEKTSAAPRPLTLAQKVEALQECGFTRVELRTMEGEVFPGGPEPYWLWVVGRTCP